MYGCPKWGCDKAAHFCNDSQCFWVKYFEIPKHDDPPPMKLASKDNPKSDEEAKPGEGLWVIIAVLFFLGLCLKEAAK